ncbi:hypothetical protein AAY473_023183 [Plecturocebus cupreus]
MRPGALGRGHSSPDLSTSLVKTSGGSTGEGQAKGTPISCQEDASPISSGSVRAIPGPSIRTWAELHRVSNDLSSNLISGAPSSSIESTQTRDYHHADEKRKTGESGTEFTEQVTPQERTKEAVAVPAVSSDKRNQRNPCALMEGSFSDPSGGRKWQSPRHPEAHKTGRCGTRRDTVTEYSIPHPHLSVIFGYTFLLLF